MSGVESEREGMIADHGGGLCRVIILMTAECKFALRFPFLMSGTSETPERRVGD
jgi:hypothetical protein